MADQVQFLNKEPPRRQLGEPGSPCNGSCTCTDVVGCMIVFHERGKRISAKEFRRKAAPAKAMLCVGLTPNELIRGLLAFGVRGYSYHPRVTASDALKATDNGIVLIGVGYNGYPTVEECEVGGKTDVRFTGPHAVSLWGRRKQNKRWYCWTRDPDHHYDGTDASGRPAPPYDKFDTMYLTRAMNAIVGNGNPGRPKWGVTFMIARKVD